MSLHEAKTLDIARKQYRYKLKAISFLGLILLQIIALVLSIGGIGMHGASNQGIYVSVHNYTGDLVSIFTLIWIFFIAVGHTKKYARNIDFTLVSNRLSSMISDWGVLATVAVLGALSATLSRMVLWVALYLTVDHDMIITTAFRPAVGDLLVDITAFTLYALLGVAAGYLTGILIEISKLFAVIVPAVFLGLMAVQNDLFLRLIGFYTTESSLLFFAGKVAVSAALLFVLSLQIYNRMEVER